MPLSTKFIAVCISKRASLERALAHRSYVYSGINSHTVRNISGVCPRRTVSQQCSSGECTQTLSPRLDAANSHNPDEGFTKHACTMTDDIQFAPLVKAELIFKTIIYVQEIKCNYYFDLWLSVM